MTLGGLVVEEDTGLVISEKNRTPIPGLYAAGRTASGVPSKSYVSGLSLADCIYSGRRAGLHAISGDVFGIEADQSNIYSAGLTSASVTSGPKL